jgi:outer membrane murein-binding lipoprotein Lpp
MTLKEKVTLGIIALAIITVAYLGGVLNGGVESLTPKQVVADSVRHTLETALAVQQERFNALATPMAQAVQAAKRETARAQQQLRGTQDELYEQQRRADSMLAAARSAADTAGAARAALVPLDSVQMLVQRQWAQDSTALVKKDSVITLKDSAITLLRQEVVMTRAVGETWRTSYTEEHKKYNSSWYKLKQGAKTFGTAAAVAAVVVAVVKVAK